MLFDSHLIAASMVSLSYKDFIVAQVEDVAAAPDEDPVELSWSVSSASLTKLVRSNFCVF